MFKVITAAKMTKRKMENLDRRKWTKEKGLKENHAMSKNRMKEI